MKRFLLIGHKFACHSFVSFSWWQRGKGCSWKAASFLNTLGNNKLIHNSKMTMKSRENRNLSRYLVTPCQNRVTLLWMRTINLYSLWIYLSLSTSSNGTLYHTLNRSCAKCFTIKFSNTLSRSINGKSNPMAYNPFLISIKISCAVKLLKNSRKRKLRVAGFTCQPKITLSPKEFPLSLLRYSSWLTSNQARIWQYTPFSNRFQMANCLNKVKGVMLPIRYYLSFLYNYVNILRQKFDSIPK